MVVLEEDQPSGSTCLLEADWETRWTHLWAFMNCCIVWQYHNVIWRQIPKLFYSSLSPFLMPTRPVTEATVCSQLLYPFGWGSDPEHSKVSSTFHPLCNHHDIQEHTHATIILEVICVHDNPCSLICWATTTLHSYNATSRIRISWCSKNWT